MRIALKRQDAAQLVDPQALSAADRIFESEYLGEPSLDQNMQNMIDFLC